jgi:beta-lactamase class A
VRRATFLGAALAATCALPVRAAAQTAPRLEDLLDDIPGTTGVIARTMGDGPPFLAIRENELFPSASVIKLAILATVYRAYDAETAKPGDLVRTRAADLIGGSDVLAGSPAGKAWTIDALVKAMIRLSDNSASNTLITAFGMASVNATMRLAGMTSSRLARHFADVVPAWHRSENVITPAEGISTIASPQSCRAMIEILLGNEDGSKIVQGLPRGTPCAHKTGEIDGVRNDAGVVDPFGDAPYVLVVLTRDLRDYTAGDDGIAAIAHRIDAALRQGS